MKPIVKRIVLRIILGIYIAAVLVPIILKLAGVISCSWWLATIALWGMLALVICALALFALLVIVLASTNKLPKDETR